MANERIQFTAQIRTAKGTVINSPSASTTVVDTSINVEGAMVVKYESEGVIVSTKPFGLHNTVTNEVIESVLDQTYADAYVTNLKHIVRVNRAGTYNVFPLTTGSKLGGIYLEGGLREIVSWCVLGYDTPFNVSFFNRYPVVSLKGAFVVTSSSILTKVPAAIHPTMTSTTGLFLGAVIFNQNLNGWSMSNVTSTESMFYGCSTYNQPLNNWDMSKVTSTAYMFKYCYTFNQPIGSVNLSNVTDMGHMFHSCNKFNQPINNWNVSKVTNMIEMFSGCSAFNQPLDRWNVSKVTNMNGMFHAARVMANSLKDWCVSLISSIPNSFNSSAPLLTVDKHPVWGTCPSRDTGNLGDWNYQDLTVEYRAGYPGRSCSFMFVTNSGEVARAADIVVNDPNGVVTVTNHDVNKGVKIASNNKSGLISIKVPARFVNFQCWDDTGQVNGVGYPALKGFRSFGNTLTHILLPIVAYNFEVPTNLPPTLKSIKFGLGIAAAVLFNNPNVSNWDVSNLLATSFNGMFAYCIDFNQDLSGWCVSQVTSTPDDFSYRAALTAANHPVWGTCPVATGNTTVFHTNIQWGPPNQAQWRVESYVYFGNFVINGVTLNFTAYGWDSYNLKNYINISATTYEQAIAGINYIKQFNAGIMRLNIAGVITAFEFNPKLITRSYPSGDDRYYRAYITNIDVWNFTNGKHGKSGVSTLSLLPA